MMYLDDVFVVDKYYVYQAYTTYWNVVMYDARILYYPVASLMIAEMVTFHCLRVAVAATVSTNSKDLSYIHIVLA